MTDTNTSQSRVDALAEYREAAARIAAGGLTVPAVGTGGVKLPAQASFTYRGVTFAPYAYVHQDKDGKLRGQPFYVARMDALGITRHSPKAVDNPVSGTYSLVWRGMVLVAGDGVSNTNQNIYVDRVTGRVDTWGNHCERACDLADAMIADAAREAARQSASESESASESAPAAPAASRQSRAS